MQHSTTQADANFDPEEITKFDALAARWWDPTGEFRALHDINPVRVQYIAARSDFNHGPVIDVGCGGGILTEAIAKVTDNVTGIDMAEKALGVARLHALDAEVEVTYHATTAEELAIEHPNRFGTVTCLEMLEHVTDYASTVQACANLAQPGANLFFSTINRNPKAYALLILGAEYVMNLLPRGTHDYSKFIQPAELCNAITNAGLEVREISGMTYNPFTHQCTINHDVDANYLVHAVKAA
jgi:2-polyprenyl-6-hydroxyphenyl methylase / 3-demethylubiquinone-9 3-methyltransferase